MFYLICQGINVSQQENVYTERKNIGRIRKGGSVQSYSEGMGNCGWRKERLGLGVSFFLN